MSDGIFWLLVLVLASLRKKEEGFITFNAELEGAVKVRRVDCASASASCA
jgi:hypothetical protein